MIAPDSSSGRLIEVWQGGTDRDPLAVVAEHRNRAPAWLRKRIRLLSVAEQKLWHYLGDRQFMGTDVFTQVPVYIPEMDRGPGGPPRSRGAEEQQGCARRYTTAMRDSAPRGPSQTFLVAAWAFFLLIVATCLWAVVWTGKWPPLRVVVGLAGVGIVWAAITGLLVRHLWPNSKVAALFPEKTTGGARYDAPVQRPLLKILLVLAGAIVVVTTTLLLGRR